MNLPDNSGLENISFNSTSTYKVMKEIARGGMGIIFLAEKNTGGVVDSVVLKSLRAYNIEEEEKLQQEASIATMLRHENIVKTYGLETVSFAKMPAEFRQILQEESLETPQEKPSIFDFFTSRKSKKIDKPVLLLIMDYVKGTDFYTLLINHIKRNLIFPVPLAAFVISRIAGALSYAHTYIVHRDISPENILISDQGVCKLTDFGVAVIAHQQPEYWAGKLMYMAPEQIRNDPIDERADIFALGLVAYQALTGISLLFAHSGLTFEDQVRVIYQQMEHNFVPAHMVRRDIPVELSRIVSKMLALAPEYRYQRAAAVVNDLEKDYLYARGFGPTNNSLASYIDIFNSNFQDYDEEQLQQLSFLKDEYGQISLKRTLRVEDFTKAGQRLLAERKGSLIVSQLRKIHKEKKKKAVVTKRYSKLPILKVKYLDNVVEAFTLDPELIVTAGRSSQNILVIPQRIVSGHHSRFYLEENTVIIEDLESHNGTFVNGERVERAELREGDKIQIGSNVLYFLWEKPKGSPERILSLSDKITDDELAVKDLALQLLPTDDMLGKMNFILERTLEHTSLGIMKRNVVTPAIYEAMRVFSGETSHDPMQLRVIRAKKYISFRLISPRQSDGYEKFLASVHRRMDNDIDLKASLEPEELAISLILKVFERIELIRFSREVVLSVFF